MKKLVDMAIVNNAKDRIDRKTGDNYMDTLAWKTAVDKFLDRYGVTKPNSNNDKEKGKGYYEFLLNDYTDLLEFGTVNGIKCMWIYGYIAGEPCTILCNTSWKWLGECNEGTNFVWEYDPSVTVNNENGDDPTAEYDCHECDADTCDEKETVIKIEEGKEMELLIKEIVAVNGKEAQKMPIEVIDVRKSNSVDELLNLASRINAKVGTPLYVDRENMLAIAKASGFEENTRKGAAHSLLCTIEMRIDEIKDAQERARAQAQAEQKTQAEAKRMAKQIAEAQAEQKAHQEKIERFVKFRKAVMDQAAINKRNGYGYTISAEYLKFLIFKVEFGVPKFVTYEKKEKGTEEFKQRLAKANKIAKWYIDKGYLKPVTWKVAFDMDTKDGVMHFERSCYAPEFDGANKNKMYPKDKCQYKGAKNAKTRTTTYAVMWK